MRVSMGVWGSLQRKALPDLISPKALASAGPIRAVDAYLAAGQIEEALYAR